MHSISAFRGLCLGAVCALLACQMETQMDPAEPGSDAAPEPAPAAQPASAPVPGPATAVAQSQIPSLTGRVASAGFEWISRKRDRPTRLLFAGQAVNMGGQTVICGVRAVRGVATRRFNGQVANGFSFVIGDQRVLQNLFFFTPAASFEALKTTPATCKATGIPWEPAFATLPWELDYTGPTRFGG